MSKSAKSSYFIPVVLVVLVGVALATFYPYLSGTSRPLPGDKRAFDPLVHKTEILAFAGLTEGHIQSFTAYDVPSSGVKDYSKNTSIPMEMRLVSPHTGGEDRPVPSTLVTFGASAYIRQITRGGGVGTDTSFYYFGMNRVKDGKVFPLSETAPWPGCSLKDVWQAAIQLGADPQDAAEITFGKDGFLFWIRKSYGMKLALDTHCRPRQNNQAAQ